MTTTWRGGPISPAVRAVLAPNPGPMTLEGTNTWVLRAARPDDGEGSVVVDPGPAGEPGHLQSVREAAGTVALTVLSHHHRDHTGAVPQWSELTDAPVRGADHGPLDDGEQLSVGGLTLQVLATPGHTPDSVCLLLPDEGLLLTGDTVLGRGTSVVPWPEGNLGDYLASLDRMIALARSGQVRRLAPGHGPVVEDPLTFLTGLKDHRLARLEQVRAALAGGAQNADDVVGLVYGDVPPEVVRPATATVRAQLAYVGHPTD